MQTVGSYEAKTHLPALLDRVTKGEEITITRHGVPVAKLVPVDSSNQRDVRAVIEELKKFAKGRTLAPYTIRELIEEGRKY
jgi:prevent-host-death family protein